MRSYEIDLQFANLIARDADIAELADTGRDRVGNLITGDDLVDHGASLFDSFPRVGCQQHGAAVHGDFADIF